MNTALSGFSVRTSGETDWINITAEVQKAVADSGVCEGICVVFVPHTTAAVVVRVLSILYNYNCLNFYGVILCLQFIVEQVKNQRPL